MYFLSKVKGPLSERAHAHNHNARVSMARVGEKKYALSCEILGHSADVRVVRCVQIHGQPREHIVTGSRDGTACIWRPDPASSTEYLLQKVIRTHTGYVSALCVIPRDTSAGRPHRKLAYCIIVLSLVFNAHLHQFVRIR